MADRVSAVMGGKKKSKKTKKVKKTKGMHIRKAATGGYIARHDSPDGMGEAEEHVIPEGGLQDHIQTNLASPDEMPAPAQVGM